MDRDKSESSGEDGEIVKQTQDLKFFLSEPGFGQIGMGVVLDPNTYKHTALWGVVLGTGVGLSSQKPALLKLLALGLTVSSLVPFSDHKFVRFTVGMATVMRFLRVCEVLMDPQYFEQRGAMYTLKFAFLYVSALLLCGGETGTDDARTA